MFGRMLTKVCDKFSLGVYEGVIGSGLIEKCLVARPKGVEARIGFANSQGLV